MGVTFNKLTYFLAIKIIKGVPLQKKKINTFA